MHARIAAWSNVKVNVEEVEPVLMTACFIIFEKIVAILVVKENMWKEVAKSAAKRTSTIGSSARNGWPVEPDI